MKRLPAALIAALCLLPAAGFQDPTDDKEKKKEEQKQREDEAKAALKAFSDKRKKSKTEEELVDAMTVLKEAKPHRLIETELLSILTGKLPYPVRTESAAILKAYKKDVHACDVLIKVAKAERIQESTDLRKRCLRTFGE